MSRVPSALIDLLERQEQNLSTTLKSHRRARGELIALSFVSLVLAAAGIPIWGGEYPALNAASAPILALIILALVRIFFVFGKSVALARHIRHLSSLLGPIRILIEDIDLTESEATKISKELGVISNMYERSRRK